MARITYSGLVTNIRGSIGGTTFQNNGYGFTVKNKANIIKPNTPLQGQIKMKFLYIVQKWTQLTTSEQSVWNAWAITNPMYSRHNPTSPLSGYGVFLKYNMIAYTSGAPLLTVPTGTTHVLPTLTPKLIRDETPPVSLMLDLDPATDEPNISCIFSLSSVVSESKNFAGTIPRRFASREVSGGNELITNLWEEKYGTIPAESAFVFLKLSFFNFDCAQVYPNQIFKLSVMSVP